MLYPKRTNSVLHLFEGHVHIEDRGHFKLHDYLISGNYYEWYFSMAEHLQPRVIAEIGVRFGYSAIAMLAGCNSPAIYIGWDNECGWPNSNVYAREHIAVFASQVFIHTHDSQIPPQSLPYPSDIEKVDLFHIDGCHTMQGVHSDLNLARQRLNAQGRILVDDTNDPEIRRAATLWCGYNGFTCFEIPSYKGMMVLREELR